MSGNNEFTTSHHEVGIINLPHLTIEATLIARHHNISHLTLTSPPHTRPLALHLRTRTPRSFAGPGVTISAVSIARVLCGDGRGRPDGEGGGDDIEGENAFTCIKSILRVSIIGNQAGSVARHFISQKSRKIVINVDCILTTCDMKQTMFQTLREGRG